MVTSDTASKTSVLEPHSIQDFGNFRAGENVRHQQSAEQIKQQPAELSPPTSGQGKLANFGLHLDSEPLYFGLKCTERFKLAEQTWTKRFHFGDKHLTERTTKSVPALALAWQTKMRCRYIL